MLTKINNNCINTNLISISATNFIPKTAVLKGIRVSKVKETDAIDFVKYDCVNPNDFSTFTIKVTGLDPIISPEKLEAMTGLTYIDIPVDKVAIKPYAIEYGVAKVSITAPMVRLHNGGMQNG